MSKRKVLVVEDDSYLRESIDSLLREEGYEVVIASNGKEALSILNDQDPPQLILLDLGLPEMDGWDLLEECGASNKWAKIPVLVITGTPVGHRHFGMKEVIMKPFDLNRILAAVKKYL